MSSKDIKKRRKTIRKQQGGPSSRKQSLVPLLPKNKLLVTNPDSEATTVKERTSRIEKSAVSNAKSSTRKLKSSMVSVQKSSREMVRQKEFEDICRLVNIDIKTEEEEVLELVRIFVRSDLEAKWSKQEDETGRIFYYFEPGNKATYTHPHLNRLKATLLNYREMAYEQKIKDSALGSVKGLNRLYKLTIGDKKKKKESDSPRNKRGKNQLEGSDLAQIEEQSGDNKSQNGEGRLETNLETIAKDPNQPKLTIELVATTEINKTQEADLTKPTEQTENLRDPNAAASGGKQTTRKKGGKKRKRKKGKQKEKKEKEIIDEMDLMIDKGLYLTNELIQKNIQINHQAATAFPTSSQSGEGNLTVEEPPVHIRILDFKSIANKHKVQATENEMAIINQEAFYQYAENYYIKKYGFPIEDIPKELTKSKAYKELTPERSFQIFYQLGLQPVDSYAFRLSVLLDILPLPPGIFEEKTPLEVKYQFKGMVIKNVFHPSYQYIKKNIELMKDKYANKMRDVKKFMFVDRLGREYEVDMKPLYKMWMNHPSRRKFMLYHTVEIKKDLFAQSDLAKVKKAYDQKIRRILEKNYEVEDETKQVSTNVSDSHMVELMRQLKLNIKSDIHLLFPIEEFVRDKEKLGKWTYRIKPNGQSYWINEEEMAVSFEYPYLAGLRAKIKLFKDALKKESKTAFLKHNSVVDKMIIDRTKGATVLNTCRMKTYYLIEKYLHSMEVIKKDPQDLTNALNNIRKELNTVLRVKLALKDFLTLIFFCKFDLEEYVIQNVPGAMKDLDLHFLKSLAPDLDMLKKYKMTNLMTRSRREGVSISRKSIYRMVTAGTRQPTNNHIGRRGSPKNGIGSNLNLSRRSQLLNIVPDLGPLEDYQYLVDKSMKSLREESNSKTTATNPGADLLEKLKSLKNSKMQNFDNLILECDEILVNTNDVDESKLNEVIKQINHIYKRLRGDTLQNPKDRIKALEEMKKKVLDRRNLVKKKSLLLPADIEEMVDQVVNSPIKLTRNSKIFNKKPLAYNLDSPRKSAMVIPTFTKSQKDDSEPSATPTPKIFDKEAIRLVLARRKSMRRLKQKEKEKDLQARGSLKNNEKPNRDGPNFLSTKDPRVLLQNPNANKRRTSIFSTHSGLAHNKSIKIPPFKRDRINFFENWKNPQEETLLDNSNSLTNSNPNDSSQILKKDEIAEQERLKKQRELEEAKKKEELDKARLDMFADIQNTLNLMNRNISIKDKERKEKLKKEQEARESARQKTLESQKSKKISDKYKVSLADVDSALGEPTSKTHLAEDSKKILSSTEHLDQLESTTKQLEDKSKKQRKSINETNSNIEKINSQIDLAQKEIDRSKLEIDLKVTQAERLKKYREETEDSGESGTSRILPKELGLRDVHLTTEEDPGIRRSSRFDPFAEIKNKLEALSQGKKTSRSRDSKKRRKGKKIDNQDRIKAKETYSPDRKSPNLSHRPRDRYSIKVDISNARGRPGIGRRRRGTNLTTFVTQESLQRQSEMKNLQKMAKERAKHYKTIRSKVKDSILESNNVRNPNRYEKREKAPKKLYVAQLENDLEYEAHQQQVNEMLKEHYKQVHESSETAFFDLEEVLNFVDLKFDPGEDFAESIPKVHNSATPGPTRDYAKEKNMIPIKFKANSFLRRKVEDFIAEWVIDQFDLSEEMIHSIKHDKVKREFIFDVKKGFFSDVIDLILRNPRLSILAVRYVFDKDKLRKQHEAIERVGKRKEEAKRRGIETEREKARKEKERLLTGAGEGEEVDEGKNRAEESSDHFYPHFKGISEKNKKLMNSTKNRLVGKRMGSLPLIKPSFGVKGPKGSRKAPGGFRYEEGDFGKTFGFGSTTGLDLGIRGSSKALGVGVSSAVKKKSEMYNSFFRKERKKKIGRSRLLKPIKKVEKSEESSSIAAIRQTIE